MKEKIYCRRLFSILILILILLFVSIEKHEDIVVHERMLNLIGQI
jgi:hypothetical protein